MKSHTAQSLEGARAIFVLPTLDLGGAERQALYLADYLRRQARCEVAVMALFGGTGKQAVRKICRENRIPCLRFSMPELALERSRDSQKPSMPAPRSLRQFIRELVFMKPDLLLPYTILPNILCGLAWKRAGASACVWGQRDAGDESFAAPLHQLAIQHTPLFCSNSDAGRDHLATNCGVPRGCVALIPNGINLPAPQKSPDAWRAEIGVSPGNLVAGMIGNIQPLKDHRTLIRAWQHVVRNFSGRPPVLCLAGECGPETGALKTLADSLGIAGSVRWLGAVEDISGLLAALDLAVLSSVREGLPNGILEPMAAGLPVAATDNAGSRQALGPAQHAFLAQPGDAGDLAAKIRALLTDATLRRSLGNANQERVSALFSVETMGRHYVRLLSGAISGHFPRKPPAGEPGNGRASALQNSVL